MVSRHEQIRQCYHNEQTIAVLRHAAIADLGKAKDALDDQKGMSTLARLTSSISGRALFAIRWMLWLGAVCIEIRENFFQAIHGRTPLWGRWFADRVLVPKHSYLLDGSFERNGLELRHRYEVLATLSIRQELLVISTTHRNIENWSLTVRRAYRKHGSGL